ncbi:unnamed protein product [Effrenium voratum]|uniref:Uncharacterized protein n=1 Tax=Effrenium voratum TaxID=2562239 RepID=A0AA36MT55_9DINO|nr:unnamed protein product [Effrenium voratum]
MLGPFIYFAGSPQDCEGKANGAKLADGAVLEAAVELGQSLVIRQDMSSAAQSSLGISSWSELDKAKLQEVGCQSVYATSDFVSRDEWAVPSNSQIRDLVLKGFESRGHALPYWQWPHWVHLLANTVNVDYAAIDQVIQGVGQVDHAPPGVRVNAAGRPIHSDGKFMSYAEARQRGWGQETSASSSPWNQGYSQAQIKQAYSGGSRSTGGSSGHTRGSPHGAQCSTTSQQTNPWNEHQKSMGGQGYSRAQIKQAYSGGSRSTGGSSGHARGSPHGAQCSTTSQQTNPWNEHQKSMGGQGYSRAQIKQAYSGGARSTGGSSGHTRGSPHGAQCSTTSQQTNPWNEHQKGMGGQGYSRAQIKQAYSGGSCNTRDSSHNASSHPSALQQRKSTGGQSSLSGTLGATIRQANPWNEHQKSMGGQGYSRADILAAYRRPTSAPSSSAGFGRRGGGSSGGLGWNAFRTSVAGQGLSRAEMSAAYSAQE